MIDKGPGILKLPGGRAAGPGPVSGRFGGDAVRGYP
jgi:hypothetical protein